MTRTTRRHWPVLATGYTRGLYANMHSLTGPIWAEWCEAHDFLYRPQLIDANDRHGALTAKFPIVVRHLAGGHPCLWSDADCFPVLDSPSPAEEMGTDTTIAAIVAPQGHPKSGHVLTGLFYTTPGAKNLLDRAIALQGDRHHASIEQRALSAALLGLVKIPDVEDPPKRSLPVHRLSRSWFCATTQRMPARRRAFAWHASTRSTLRIPTLELWIAQGRHTHPAADPLPRAWRIPTHTSDR